jgi:hypothetical protein
LTTPTFARVADEGELQLQVDELGATVKVMTGTLGVCAPYLIPMTSTTVDCHRKSLSARNNRKRRYAT